MLFPCLKILIINFPGSKKKRKKRKKINSEMPNTKLNLSSHRKVVNKDEFYFRLVIQMTSQETSKNMN